MTTPLSGPLARDDLEVVPASAVKRLKSNKLVALASAIIGTQMSTAVLGLAFWTVAARNFSVGALGVAGACIASMGLLGMICMLGLGTLLIGEIPLTERDEVRGLMRSALTVCGCLAFAVGCGYALVAPAVVGPLQVLRDSPQNVVLFGAGVAFTCVGAVLDEAMLVTSLPSLQVLRNVVASTVKLAALPIALMSGWTSPMGIFGCWAIGLFVGDAMAWLAVRKRYVRGIGGLSVLLQHMRNHGGTAALHHTVNLALSTPTFVLPVIVATSVGRTANAHYTTARLVAGMVFLVPFAISVALFASSSVERAALKQRARQSFLVAMGISCIAYVFLFFLAHPLLLIFGGEYASSGTDVLRILTIAGPFLVVKDQYIAIVRTERAVRTAVLYVISGSLLEMGLAYWGAHTHGLDGCVAGFVVGVGIEALVFGPRVLTFIGLWPHLRSSRRLRHRERGKRARPPVIR